MSKEPTIDIWDEYREDHGSPVKQTKAAKATDPNAVIYRGSVCGYCAQNLLTNMRGTVVHHDDGVPYGKCRQSMKGSL